MGFNPSKIKENKPITEIMKDQYIHSSEVQQKQHEEQMDILSYTIIFFLLFHNRSINYWLTLSVYSNTRIPAPFASHHNAIAICFHTDIALGASEIKTGCIFNQVTMTFVQNPSVLGLGWYCILVLDQKKRDTQTTRRTFKTGEGAKRRKRRQESKQARETRRTKDREQKSVKRTRESVEEREGRLARERKRKRVE
ncbi:hypothetical protein RCL_jg20943.t1 [Rhizophagus clarus]|uniref:Uncharacterized protein n=1 Tax=Rhizophagus clarus TaxID=94130 RepID=A0A8H3LEI0_9GLOM|nr:hypothetical protein RCL_jg20943.t1 [Rhizophagus clarus]